MECEVISHTDCKVPYRIEECIKRKFLGRITIQGYSKAGERTGFYVEEWGVALDAGLVSSKYPKACCITHSHVDHSISLPMIIGCRAPKVKGQEHLNGIPTFMPASMIPMMQTYEETIQDLSAGTKTHMGSSVWAAQRTHPIGVIEDQIHEVDGIRDLYVEILRCYHTADSVGFGLHSITKKMREEYIGLPGKEIGRLKKEGVDMFYDKIDYDLVFFGDTNIRALEKHDEWKKYKIIMIECTGYPNTSAEPDDYIDRGHVHWNQVLPFVVDNPDNFFVLIHSSQSATDEYLRDLQTETNLPNLLIWTQSME